MILLKKPGSRMSHDHKAMQRKDGSTLWGATKGADPLNHVSEKQEQGAETGLLYMANVAPPHLTSTVCYVIMIQSIAVCSISKEPMKFHPVALSSSQDKCLIFEIVRTIKMQARAMQVNQNIFENGGFSGRIRILAKFHKTCSVCKCWEILGFT